MESLSKLRTIKDYHAAGKGAAEAFRDQEAIRIFAGARSGVGLKIRLFGKDLPDHLKGELILTEALAEEFANVRAKERIPKALGIHDAAAIVFAHSVFEGLVQDFFDLDFRLSPESWDVNSPTVNSAIARRLIRMLQASEPLRGKRNGGQLVARKVSRRISMIYSVDAKPEIRPNTTGKGLATGWISRRRGKLTAYARL